MNGTDSKVRRAGTTPGAAQIIHAALLLTASLLAYPSAGAGAQVADIPQTAPTVDLAGPRLGFTLMTGGVADELRERTGASPIITQFGWQWERRFMALDEAGTTAITELVFLLGGMDQGIVLPSVTWLVGFRGAAGTEFAVGPNISPAGGALAFAVGVSTQVGNLNVPINLAVVPNRQGTRISILTGFNVRTPASRVPPRSAVGPAVQPTFGG